jgi:hypothetical protein
MADRRGRLVMKVGTGQRGWQFHAPGLPGRNGQASRDCKGGTFGFDGADALSMCGPANGNTGTSSNRNGGISVGRSGTGQTHPFAQLKKSELKKNNAVATLTRGKLEIIDMYNDFLRGNSGKKNIKTAQQFGSLTSSQTLLTASSSSTATIPRAERLIDIEMASKTSKKEIPTFASFSLD